MMSDLGVLYDEVVLDHRRRPRNFRALEGGLRAEGSNPLCGDRLTVFVRMKNETIEEAAFQGYGCAVAIASASLMTESVKGRTLAEAAALFQRFRQMITAPAGAPVDDLGGLSALAGVRQFAVRVKCATLPWQALLAAAGGGEAVSTE
jgi:nitrogen fixation NifU-like protein